MLQQLLLSCVAISLLFASWSAPAAKSYSADRFDVDVVVQSDGSLLVTETLALRFAGGPFTYVYRRLIPDLTDGIEFISASIDGGALTQGTAPGQVEIQWGNPIKVTWHFAPTSDATHTYGLTYRMRGVVRREAGADLLRFQPLPDEHEYTIASSTVRISYPETAHLIGAPQVQAGEADVERGASSVTFSARSLEPNATLVVDLRFSPGSLISAPPRWQARQDEVNRRGPVFLGAAAILTVLGSVIVLAYRSRYRRPSGGEFELITSPPRNTPPAIAGLLAYSGNTQYAWAYALGAFFDLARRDVVSIEEITPESRWNKHEFVLHLHSVPADLRPHERALIQAYFGAREGTVSTIPLRKLQNNLYQRLQSFSRALKAEAEALGLFDKRYQSAYSVLLFTGLFLMFGSLALGVALGILLMGTFGGWPLVIAGSLFIVGFVALIAGVTISPLTEESWQEAQAWRQFYRYLKDVTRQRATLTYTGHFAEYLPYAAAFGIAGAWADYLKKHEGVELPRWFRAMSTAPHDGAAAFVVMMAAVNSSVGSSSSAAAAAGAAGAAGGGGSGAG